MLKHESEYLWQLLVYILKLLIFRFFTQTKPLEIQAHCVSYNSRVIANLLKVYLVVHANAFDFNPNGIFQDVNIMVITKHSR